MVQCSLPGFGLTCKKGHTIPDNEPIKTAVVNESLTALVAVTLNHPDIGAVPKRLVDLCS